ncbi:hypothetical protein IWX50DRAFT_333130 [Phyllosticta citricarpa]|uniref:Uncharacterized protein n=1 Tax=Phyllosticta citricarpa TaxID=55181 RepID=A0ABR1LIF1_9PEZI
MFNVRRWGMRRGERGRLVRWSVGSYERFTRSPNIPDMLAGWQLAREKKKKKKNGTQREEQSDHQWQYDANLSRARHLEISKAGRIVEPARPSLRTASLPASLESNQLTRALPKLHSTETACWTRLVVLTRLGTAVLVDWTVLCRMHRRWERQEPKRRKLPSFPLLHMHPCQQPREHRKPKAMEKRQQVMRNSSAIDSFFRIPRTLTRRSVALLQPLLLLLLLRGGSGL